MDWEDYGTAPKDGRRFLAYRRDGKGYWILAWNQLKQAFYAPGTNTSPIFTDWTDLPDGPEVLNGPNS